MRATGYGLIITAAIIFSGCTLSQMVKLAKEQKVQVNPNPLEVHNNTVVFTLSGNLPVKLMKKGTVYSINTFYAYSDGGQEIAFEPYSFKAEDYPSNSTEPISVNKEFSFPYKDAYKSGTIDFEGMASKNGKFKKTERISIATGIITTSKLVQNAYYTSTAFHGYNNQEELIPVVIPDFLFARGSAVLRRSEKKSEKAQQLDAFIASKNVTRTVTITGTHSPEGLERINSKLSENRAKVIEDYYRGEMDRYDYQGMADSIRFILKPIVDDWGTFKNALNDYEGISAEEKSAYQSVINGGGSFEEKEKQLQKLPTYRKVFKDIYPALRKAKTEILKVKEKKTDEQIASLSRQIVAGSVSADTLNFEELMYAATLTPSIEEKANIYQAATKKKANWVSHNNLGATYLQWAIDTPSKRDEYLKKAEADINIALNQNSASPEVNANMATISLMNGNHVKAAEFASKALSSNPSNEIRMGVNGVKGACEIYSAKYGSAISSTSAAVDTDVNLFNKGLAQLLNKDFANASGSFAEATRKNGQMAIAFYGAAIASARQSQGDAVVSNLSKAVKIDPSLKQKALEDLEFAKFNTSEAFRNALK